MGYPGWYPISFDGLYEGKKETLFPNVLFICVDDLWHEIGWYGSVVKAPYLDKLTSGGSLLFSHYTQWYIKGERADWYVAAGQIRPNKRGLSYPLV